MKFLKGDSLAAKHTDDIPKTIEVLVYTYVSAFSVTKFIMLMTYP